MTALDLITNLIIEFSPNMITSILMLIIELWPINIITKAFKRIMIEGNIEITLSNFNELPRGILSIKTAKKYIA
jgi:small conductance mechanosensitive channel